MGLRGKRADAFCVRMVEEDGHKGNCKRSLCHTVLGVPKLSGRNDKISRDCNQYDDQTRDRRAASPLRKSFSSMVGRGPYDLALRKHDSRTRAVSCIPGHRCASRVRLLHPPQSFSFPSLSPPPMTRADSRACCTGVCHSCATRNKADRREHLLSHSCLRDIPHLAWWSRIDKDGLS